MKKIFCVLLTAVLLTVGVTGCGSDTAQDSSEEQVSSENAQSTEKTVTDDSGENEDLLSGTHHAQIVVKKYGTISVELDADTAPITVTNFVKLAKEGFYDGLTFHRIISGFMIQGGDPLGNGTGGSDETIQGEFSSNGIENDISHTRGVISMARSTDYDSASSQFFIMHQDTPSLDGEYAAFGEVTDGMEIVDQICEDTPVEDTNGTVAAENQPVIKTIKIID
ncbi:MAG: peptidylprolyl isomerase [Clostridiaceae bacterium]|nr:peptidylprolyl isomerase [Clostridiaceae bacterium]